jgi:hypothetical protein
MSLGEFLNGEHFRLDDIGFVLRVIVIRTPRW